MPFGAAQGWLGRQVPLTVGDEVRAALTVIESSGMDREGSRRRGAFTHLSIERL